jgi:uncharacterized repeat protein (TIGR03803 family)
MNAKKGRQYPLALLFCVTIAVTSRAQTFTNLANFDITNGNQPGYGSLVQGIDGNLYGTTVFGGVGSSCTYTYGCGTVFKVTPNGVLTTLYSFCSLPNCTDGYNPYGGLVLMSNGNLYGTAQYGGVGGYCYPSGCGTIFEITPQGKLSTIFDFGSSDYNGFYPLDTLIVASNGNFYGTSSTGGVGAASAGTIFEITPSGNFTDLYNFCSNCGDVPYFPQFGLVQASNGNLYSAVGFDIVEITLSGSLTIPYSGYVHGYTRPVGSLIQATDGNLYGTTSGTAFKMTLGGTMTTLYTFCSQPYCTDGNLPMSGVIQGTDGNFYGTTSTGGAACTGYAYQGCGTVFEITASGKLTTLHSFDGHDGDAPWAGLVQATNGDFYGTTSVYGTGSGVGTIFRLSMGLAPFVRALPNSGKVGAKILILGTNLKGSTSVTFNGAAATFQIVSAAEIIATIPAGATTGTIDVARPSGTLKSNVPFQVR